MTINSEKNKFQLIIARRWKTDIMTLHLSKQFRKIFSFNRDLKRGKFTPLFITNRFSCNFFPFFIFFFVFCCSNRRRKTSIPQQLLIRWQIRVRQLGLMLLLLRDVFVNKLSSAFDSHLWSFTLFEKRRNLINVPLLALSKENLWKKS